MDDHNALPSFLDLEVTGKDAPQMWAGAPPNWGKDVVAHIDTVAGQAGLAGQAYLNADEAMRHDPQNSERMRADCGIMECLEARYRASALCNWHIEPSNGKSLEQKDLAEQMTRIIETTPDFLGMRIWLNEAIYFGRSGTALKFASEEVGGYRRTVVSDWEPRHGDKFAFRYDTGTGKHDPRQVGIRVASFNSRHLNRKQIERTAEGMVYWFTPQERKTFILHKHLREDGPFDNPWVSGRIHGVGIRSRIYWTWFAQVECLQRALEYLDRSAFGVELWRYPGNSSKAKADTERAAKRSVSGGRSIILVPVFQGDDADSYGVEHIEPGLAGFDRLLTVIKEFFQMKIKRYILGQTLTSEAEATGMGSGVADAHLATFAEIVSCDAQRLAETLTRDFVRHLQLWNFPGSEHCRLNFKIDTESDDVEAKLKAIKAIWDMGGEIDQTELFAAAGLSVPTENAKTVFNPQLVAAIRQMQQTPSGLIVPMNGGPDPIAVAIQGIQLQPSRLTPGDRVQKESYSAKQPRRRTSGMRELAVAMTAVADRPLNVRITQEPSLITIEAKPAIVNIEPATVNVHVPEQVPPSVNVNIPEQLRPVVNVTTPEQKTPIVHFRPNIQLPDNVAAVVNITTPKQEPPVVNVTTPAASAPDVHVTVNPELVLPERKPMAATVVRDKHGNITGIEPKP